MPADYATLLSRRQLFLLAGAGVAARLPLAAAGTDFWNKKAPADWTTEEIDRLITKSPWAKVLKAQYASGAGNPGDGGGYPGGSGTGGGYPGGSGGSGTGGGYPGGSGRTGGGIGIPGIGGLSIPGIGGMGRGRGGNGGSPRGGGASPYEGTVRWESARPILDAMKTPLPEGFDGHYAISVSGIPLLGSRSTGSEEDDSTASRRQDQDDLDRLKGLSSLKPKGKDIVQAGVVMRQVTSGSSFLFGFSRELLPLDAHDGEVLFTAQLGRLVVKAGFLPKEMQYHGVLAV